MGTGMRRRSIFLLQKVVVCYVENIGTAEKSVGTVPRNARSARGICMVEKPDTGNGGSNKTCNSCSIEGHNESQCYKKNPKNAPEWWKDKNAKVKSAMSSVEIC
jgi:hypothetical protein